MATSSSSPFRNEFEDIKVDLEDLEHLNFEDILEEGAHPVVLPLLYAKRGAKGLSWGGQILITHRLDDHIWYAYHSDVVFLLPYLMFSTLLLFTFLFSTFSVIIISIDCWCCCHYCYYCLLCILSFYYTLMIVVLTVVVYVEFYSSYYDYSQFFSSCYNYSWTS